MESNYHRQSITNTSKATNTLTENFRQSCLIRGLYSRKKLAHIGKIYTKMREAEKPTSDSQYQAILTQRSVARAALHLGIETLPSNTLTVLQDALTQYIERVGRVISNNVEHSGRSSHHVNVLDAIRGVEDCALVDVATYHKLCQTIMQNSIEKAEEEGKEADVEKIQSITRSMGSNGEWETLAQFLFGDNFFEDADNDDEADEISSSARESGKFAGKAAREQASAKAANDSARGWNAPLDEYDSLASFPIYRVGKRAVASQNTESGTSLYRPNEYGSVGKSLSNTGNGMAHSAFMNGYQAANNTSKGASDLDSKPSTKRKREDDTQENDTKRSKTENGSASTKRNTKDSDDKKGDTAKDPNGKKVSFTNGEGSLSSKSESLPGYVPKFLPPFPPKHTYTKSSKPVIPAFHTFDTQDVKSSLVQLGNSYWGSIPSDTEYKTKETKKKEGISIKVTTQPLDPSRVGNTANKGLKEAVRPISRASNARVSKILEGSMDLSSI